MSIFVYLYKNPQQNKGILILLKNNTQYRSRVNNYDKIVEFRRIYNMISK